MVASAKAVKRPRSSIALVAAVLVSRSQADPAPAPAPVTIFVSKDKHVGDFSDYAGGASEFCTSSAGAANLTGDWCAILATEATPALMACSFTLPLVIVGGELVIESSFGSSQLVNRNEFGDEAIGEFWSGSTMRTCTDWTSVEGQGSVGRVNQDGSTYWKVFNRPCITTLPVVCVRNISQAIPMPKCHRIPRHLADELRAEPCLGDGDNGGGYSGHGGNGGGYNGGYSGSGGHNNYGGNDGGYSGNSGHSGYGGNGGYSGYSGYGGNDGGFSGYGGHSGGHSGYGGHGGNGGYSGYGGNGGGYSGYGGHNGYSGHGGNGGGYSGYGGNGGGYSGSSSYGGWR